ncbi:MAG TPA: DUF1521 domain-containing protein [Myxococcaceae bacterium]|jgi:hypothetical protein
MALQVGQNFVQTPQITQWATANAAAATATAGGAQAAGGAGATGFGGQLQQIIQTLQALAAKLGAGAGAQAQGPFMPGAPNPADAGQAQGGATAQGGANAGAGAATARAFAGIGPDGKPYAFAEAGGNVAQAGGANAGTGTGAATGSSSGGATAGAGAMSGDDKSITTKGGYKIESTGGASWSITGPDGKKTDIQGDPHVIEKDGGRWDFPKDATFTLGDGTKVNVKVENTVSQKLEVTDGNQRAEIDAQTGKAGPLEQGPAKFDTTQNAQFVMGKDAEQWTKDGREIKGGGMDGNQELGEQVATAPGAANAAPAGGAGAPGQAQAPAQQGGLQGIIGQIQNLLQQLGIPGAGANNAAQGAQAPAAQAPAQQAAGQDPIQALTQQIQQLAQQLGGGAGAAPAQQAPAAQAPAAQAPAQQAQGGGTQDALGAITKMIAVLGQVLQLFQGLGGQGQKLAA